MVTDTHFYFRGQPLRNDRQQDALCLRDEVMELANEILKDELNASTIPRALQCTGMERDGLDVRTGLAQAL
jgi:hypothetical protein